MRLIDAETERVVGEAWISKTYPDLAFAGPICLEGAAWANASIERAARELMAYDLERVT